MILADVEIRKLAEKESMIVPFIDHQEGRPSYGLSSYGYDIRLAPEFKVFTNLSAQVIDPLDFPKEAFTDVNGLSVVIPPNSFALARSVERIKVPRDVMVLCLGKSTYARCGIIVNVTPLEPGWEGFITIEISNTTPLPVRVHANQGIAQLIFLESDTDCAVSYADRKGKYQDQEGITLPR